MLCVLHFGHLSTSTGSLLGTLARGALKHHRCMGETMKKLLGFASPLLALAVTACGGKSPRDPLDNIQEPLACGRYEVLADDETCAPVAVQGIENRELSFTRNGYTLHGTLTLPIADDGYLPPVFVLAHGSGPSDRDATAPGHLGIGYGRNVPTFRLLAEALANAGAAVYRYDKRTCFKENSEGRCPTPFSEYPADIGEVFVEDYIEDLRTAVRAVAGQTDVDGADITVIGHSQGANHVPLLVGSEPGVVAGVQLAGASLPVDQLLVGQLRELADRLEAEDPVFAQDVAALRADADRYETSLAAIRSGTFEGTHLLGVSPEYWLRWMQNTDRLEEEFLAVNEPLLLLNGDWDFNVALHHLERFQGWAEAAGKTNAEFVLVPGATHGFVTVTNGGRGIDTNFSPAALEAILEWHQRTAD